MAGGTRLRRRLSRIFQRAMSGRRLRTQTGARGHDGKQPPENLPVAPYPAVLAPRVGEDARGVVVHDLDVGHQRRARVESLEQIVREQRVLRHAPFERRRKGIDVVESFAREYAFAEEILVDVGHGGRVGIDAGVAGVGAREERARRARHRHADARLQDAVALGDASAAAGRNAAGSTGAR